MARSALALGAVLALLAACSDDSDGVFTGMPDRAEPGGGAGVPGSPEAVASAATEDVQAFWSESFPEVYGSPFEPLTGGWYAYSATDLPPQCGPGPFEYEEIARNAFYCPLEDFVAYDEEALLPWLAEEFGSFAIGIVIAHEYGHAVQQRSGDLEGADSVRIEMQADCMAGAWTRWIGDGNSDSFEISVDQLDSAIAGMIAIRDPAGSNPNAPAAHGSGFDRVNAFQDGFDSGAERCAEYPALHQQGELVVTQIPFSSPEELANQGNLHLDDRGAGEPGLLTLAEEYLNIFYERLFDEQLGREWTPPEDMVVVDPARDEVTCEGETLRGQDELQWFSAYCSEENTIVVDGGTMAPRLFESIGDFAVGTEIGRLWAAAAQEQLGVADGSKSASLQADCLTGYWSGALFPDDGGQTALGPHPDREGIQLSLSPGDLDEGIQSILAYGDARRDEGTVFERATAMSDGVNDGIDGMDGTTTCTRFHPLVEGR